MAIVKRVGSYLFWALVIIGWVDMTVHIISLGETRLIHNILSMFFPFQ